MTGDYKGLIEYPSNFPIKIMGLTHDRFIPTISKIIAQYDSTFHMDKLEIRLSSKGRYTGLTATVHVLNRENLDKLYLTLSSHPMVKMVL